MKIINRIAILALWAATASVSACSKEVPLEDTAVPAPLEHTQPDTGTSSDAKAAAGHFATGMMSAYEECRALLAADTSASIAVCASGIEDASRSAHASAPAAAHSHIGTVVTAARALASAPADDIETVRLRFGDLSKAIIAMLVSAPEVAADYHIFECPMAKGYKRWAQPTAVLANPYMGTSMGNCGSEVHADPQDARGHTEHSH